MSTCAMQTKSILPLSALLNTSEENSDEFPLLLKLNKKRVRSKAGTTYQIIRYDKDFLSFDLYLDLGMYRSIILNLDTKKVVAMAPPKSLQLENQTFKGIDFKDIQVQEFVEGTMINVFWDDSNNIWEISTRSSIGANVKFYQGKDTKTFKQMFEETLESIGEKDLFNKLDKNLMYSFVIQHPENRIVTPFKDPNLYLIDVYQFSYEDDNIIVKSYNVQNLELNDVEVEIFNAVVKESNIKLPKIYSEYNSVDECVSYFRSGDVSYDIVGAVFKHVHSNIRSKVRNPVYEEIRHLKGNYPKKQYRYLALRKSGKMTEYLKIFNEDRGDFSYYREGCHKFTNRLYNYYVGCYIKKNKELRYYPFQYRTHMIALHQLYVHRLKPEGNYIRKHHIVDYFNLLHPSQQMFALNYNMRKLSIDTFVAENNN
jgi:hypothetical protein